MYCHMKMNARTVGWLVFLAIIKNVSCDTDLFIVTDGSLTAKEGSCIELKWELSRSVSPDGAYWFWLKDAGWVNRVLTGTVIYSTDETKRPVDPMFAARVTYNGSPSSSWVNYWDSYSRSSRKVSILICDLRITDSGGYSFRFIGREPWLTKPPVTLRVTVNQCLITFEKPPVVKENGTVTLTCSTRSSCRSELQIRSLKGPSLTNHPTVDRTYRKTTVSLTADWNDDGREFSCQTRNEVDRYLIRKISLSVEYAPRETLAKITPEKVVEGQTMTLTCSAKGRPEPNFTWFRNGQQLGTGAAGAMWVIGSIQESENGEYHCKARNKQGEKTSQSLTVDVEYKPVVEAWSSASTVTQGSKMTLTCNVTRSNPQPHTYVWFKNWMHIGEMQTLVIEHVQPKDHGAYICKASNTVGTGESMPFKIEVQYAPRKPTLSITEHDEEVFPLVGVGSFLLFSCDAVAYPEPQTYSWYRYRSSGQLDSSQWKSKTTQLKWLSLDSVKRADEGCYRCKATNIINTGEDSEEECIQVVYAPKHTEITRLSEHQRPDGTTAVVLSCSSHSDPVSQYAWYKVKDGGRDEKVSDHQNHTVYSDQPGAYYCIAKNDIDQMSSEPLHLFDRSLTNALRIFFVLFIPLLILVIVLGYRYKRKKSNQQGTANSGFLAWWRDQTDDPGMAGPFRSRDDLLREQLHRPDSTPASGIDSVHCVVNPPSGQQNEERLEDYENVSIAHKARDPTPSKPDTDTSEDEVEVNYSQVSFKVKHGRQRASRDSSSSDKEATQYSEVNI